MGVPGAARASATVLLLTVLVSCDSGRATPEDAPPESARAARAEPTPDPYEGWLLPNMRSTAARDLQIEAVGDLRRLRFAALLANTGDGPMHAVPRGRSGCPRGQLRVRQLVQLDGDRDGVFQRRRDVERRLRPGGCMLDHPTHDHWHFDAMASYALTVPGTPLRVARDKVSFCLRDNERVPSSPRVVRRSYFGECTADGPQGISPGWVDVYDADLDGQWLRVPARIDRRPACLVLEADPDDLLLESDETDNATAVPIRIDGTDVRRRTGGC